MSATVIPTEAERQLLEFNAMQKVKRRFFAMRNGDLAAQMASLGATYKMNFGLNLPQIAEIARDFLPGGAEAAALGDGFDYAEFARRLRDNITTRESMLIAPMLFPVEALGSDEAFAWASSVPTAEVSDILCMKLLRRHPAAMAIVNRLADSEVPLRRYTSLRLLLNLLQTGHATSGDVTALLSAEESRSCRVTSTLCRQLRDELAFISD